MGWLWTAYDFGQNLETYLYLLLNAHFYIRGHVYTIKKRTIYPSKQALVFNNLLKKACLIAKINTFLVYLRNRMLSEVTPFYRIFYSKTDLKSTANIFFSSRLIDFFTEWPLTTINRHFNFLFNKQFTSTRKFHLILRIQIIIPTC